MALPEIKLDRGLHLLHLFYRVNRTVWSDEGPGRSAEVLKQLEAFCARYAAASHPKVATYANASGKADLCFILYAAQLGQLGEMHRELESYFAPGALEKVYSFFSVTELSEYTSGDEDHRRSLIEQEKLDPDSELFQKRFKEIKARMDQYAHYRLYPEMPDWEVMGFYPMNKRRSADDNWYRLSLEARKELMGGHARVGRKYAGRVSQLITGATGLDDWEWGVTLVAHQVDALKEIVYEMRFDEVSARYAEFGPFFINLRLNPADLWAFLRL